MEDLLVNGLQCAPDHRRLLGGWRDILNDLRHLCASVTRLPDHCACGDGGSHLTGSCPCCHAAHDPRLPDCPDCRALLVQLRPKVDTLIVDTVRFFPVVKILLTAPEWIAIQAEGRRIESHISRVARTFDRLVAAADEFQSGCRASHLRTLKREAMTLLAEVQRLDDCLEKRQ